MGLSIGARLGPYEILSPLGAGGMGEVYKARDTRLDRTVAIKVLSDGTAGDPDFRARFHREAKAIGALNHPHICTLHDVGQHDGVDFLVMELVEGQTLATRLRNGLLTLDKAVAYAIDIADALDKAHRAGIVHRDLKPANVMLTKEGAKLMDFGIARMHPGAGADVSSATGLSTETASLTAQGGMLGTIQYMAPEVLEGHPADARSDIFAFGALVYEMTAGRRAFDGASHPTIIAAILNSQPPRLSTLQPLTPPALEHLVVTCLAKDPDERWQSAADVKRELLWISQAGPASTAPRAPRRAVAFRNLAWLLAGAAVSAAVVMLLGTPGSTDSVRTPPARFEIRLDDGWQVESCPAISGDGTHIAYVAKATGTDSEPLLYVRALDTIMPVALAGTAGARDPFFSPDGQSVGFFKPSGLARVSIGGGAPTTIDQGASYGTGAAWGTDDRVIFNYTPFTGLRRVPSRGGEVQTLTVPRSDRREVGHESPEVLPGNRGFVFTVTNADSFASSKIGVYSYKDAQSRILLDGGMSARYASSGHLVYARESALMAVPFDPNTLELRGAPAQVLDHVARFGSFSCFSIAASGALVYTEGEERDPRSNPLWVERDGQDVPLQNAFSSDYFDPAISPNGLQVAFSVRGPNQDIWVHDIKRETWTRLSHGAGMDMAPVWVAGGSRIVFSSGSGQGTDLFSVPADGAGAPELLFKSPGWKWATSWSEVHKLLAFEEGGDIWLLNLSGSPKAEPFLRTAFDEGAPTFSPNGRWIAYESNESGQAEIYARPLRGPGKRWQISTGGGRHPRWSPKGDELLYVFGNRVMTTKVAPGEEFSAGRPTVLTVADYYYGGTVPNYDITPDGHRLLMIRRTPPPPPRRSLIVVQDFTRDIGRRVPVQ